MHHEIIEILHTNHSVSALPLSPLRTLSKSYLPDCTQNDPVHNTSLSGYRHNVDGQYSPCIPEDCLLQYLKQKQQDVREPMFTKNTPAFM